MANTPIPRPICSEEVENWLRSRGANFLRCMLIPVENFDERASRNNQARPTPLRPDKVDEYAMAMRRGDKFPPLVAYRTSEKSTTFILISGNHRLAGGKKAGVKQLPTYVLASDTPPELILLLTVEANAHHGAEVPTEWRVKQALNLIAAGWKQDESCAAAQISTSALHTYKKSLEADERARRMKITNFSQLGAKHKTSLQNLKLDNAFMQAAIVTINTNMNQADTQQMVRELRVLPSEAEQIAHIQMVADERRKVAEQQKLLKRRSGIINNPKQSLITGIGKIMHTDGPTLVRTLITDAEKQEIWDRLGKVADKVLELQVLVEESMKQGEAEAG